MPFNMSSTSVLPENSALLSQQRTAKSLTLIEKLDIYRKIIATFLSSFGSILFSIIFRRASSKPPSLSLLINYALSSGLTSRLTPRQWNGVNPSDDEAYIEVSKKWGKTPKSIVLEDGTSANWIGNPDAKTLIVNFHGGGYVFSAPSYMVEYMFRIQKFLTDSGKDVAVLMLAYDLAPDAKYPRQLQQANLLFHHLIDDLHRDPSRIILTGDSAGANLGIALMSHVLHPHPSPTIPPLTLPCPIRGMIMLSPWVDFSFDRPSIKANRFKDYITPQTARLWAAGWLGTPWPHANTDFYNQPITAPQDWWEGFQVDEILVLAGKDEVLVDGILKFGETLQAVKGKEDVQIFAAPGESHDFPNMEIYFKVKEMGEQTKLTRSWLAERCE